MDYQKIKDTCHFLSTECNNVHRAAEREKADSITNCITRLEVYIEALKELATAE